MIVNTRLDTTAAGINLIKRWEAFEAGWYLCPAGVWTIGYGTIDTIYKRLTGRSRDMSTRLTEAEATRLLELALVSIFEPVVERYVTVSITPQMFDALVSFSYNVGPTNFRKSTLLRKFNAGDPEGAAREFSRWRFAKDPKTGQRRELRGLKNRRAQEEALFRAGMQELNRIEAAAEEDRQARLRRQAEETRLEGYQRRAGAPQRLTPKPGTRLPLSNRDRRTARRRLRRS